MEIKGNSGASLDDAYQGESYIDPIMWKYDLILHPSVGINFLIESKLVWR